MSQPMPPHLRARYGLDRSRAGTRALVAVVVLAFVAALVFVGWAISRPKVNVQVQGWQVVAPDRVDVTFEVRRDADEDVWCVLRAQDEQRADVAYTVVLVPAGLADVSVPYRLRTVAPAFVVEVLGCGLDGPPVRVPGPQFPPGVVAPEQPWTP